MKVSVVALPAELTAAHLNDRSVVVFDVLRATTTLTAALHAGVREVRIFGDIASAQSAAIAYGPGALLCGEVRCLPPPGFDLGNSPGAFQPELHRDRVAFFSTSNGTKAIVAAQSAPAIFAGAIVNAAAVAARLLAESRDVTLLCAGTNGEIAMEDLLGAGAIYEALADITDTAAQGELATIARTLFRGCRGNLEQAMRNSTGGQNVITARLEGDIAFAAKLNALDVVGVVRASPLRVML